MQKNRLCFWVFRVNGSLTGGNTSTVQTQQRKSSTQVSGNQHFPRLGDGLHPFSISGNNNQLKFGGGGSGADILLTILNNANGQDIVIHNTTGSAVMNFDTSAYNQLKFQNVGSAQLTANSLSFSLIQMLRVAGTAQVNITNSIANRFQIEAAGALNFGIGGPNSRDNSGTLQGGEGSKVSIAGTNNQFGLTLGANSTVAVTGDKNTLDPFTLGAASTLTVTGNNNNFYRGDMQGGKATVSVKGNNNNLDSLKLSGTENTVGINGNGNRANIQLSGTGSDVTITTGGKNNTSNINVGADGSGSKITINYPSASDTSSHDSTGNKTFINIDPGAKDVTVVLPPNYQKDGDPDPDKGQKYTNPNDPDPRNEVWVNPPDTKTENAPSEQETDDKSSVSTDASSSSVSASGDLSANSSAATAVEATALGPPATPGGG